MDQSLSFLGFGLLLCSSLEGLIQGDGMGWDAYLGLLDPLLVLFIINCKGMKNPLLFVLGIIENIAQFWRFLPIF
ncbi:Hypothetical predicted protein [Prunus dulcis]|uniref:Uncharacterized protein n=1 Tax=Prunus dulcis TaxID=3755 RepID=A0A5E4FTU1_PRUDU|nr:hypothetical protein L3X38_038012 [Prunus dulcis]VVA30931.1 Hypothetical predicted protein [Prunus dulcis]